MKDNWLHLIDKFSSQKLSSAEQSEFDELYANDTDFKKEVDFINDLKIVAQDADQQSFKEMLEAIQQKEASTTKKAIPRKLWISVIAAAAVVVIVFSIFYANQGISNDELYAANFTPHANTLAPIERSESLVTTQEKAFFAYENNNFEEAITLFEEIEEEAHPNIQFYKASSLMALGQVEEAIPILEEFAQQNETYSSYAHWYLALAYLKRNQVAKSKKQLQMIIANDYYPSKKAQALLAELE